ncbi:MAG TPA: hypothetical protein VEV87_03770 [Chitinophagaceae bacterium]|nr:hypothetical protein [Chitinophagaceae bacterium]
METIHWIQAGFYFFAIIGIWLSWKTFKANQRVRRAEWLQSLFERFYEKDTYKDARRWIDFKLLEKELANDPDHKKEEKLADYLNFFEFIAMLDKMKQLSLSEIKLLFLYYLDQIKQSAFCMQYVKESGYRNLSNLLARI